MWKNRLLWMLWLCGALFLYLFGNDAGTLAVLAASIVLPLACILLAAVQAKYLDTAVCAPQQCVKGKSVQVTIRLNNRGILPVPWAELWFQTKNIYTGDAQAEHMALRISAGSTLEIRRELCSIYCGKLAISLQQMCVRDVFGLSTWRTGQTDHAVLSVLPQLFPVQVVLCEDINAIIDSDRYSMYEPGTDPSETFAVREYVPGDSLKSIHWKLSQKSDQLLVRDLGKPVVDEALLLFEGVMPDSLGRIAPIQADAMAEVLFSVSASLLEQGIPFAIGWSHIGGGMLEVCQVGGEEGLAEAMDRLLGHPVGPGEEMITGCLMREMQQCAYAHVLVVSAYVEPDIHLLRNGNRITVLLVNAQTAESAMRPDGIYVRAVSPADYAEELQLIEC